MNTPIKTQYVPLRVAAAELGISKEWLRDEATAGRIPYLACGKRRLFDVEQVRIELAETVKREFVARKADA